MAWIKSDQEIRDNPKTRRLARALNTSVPATIGHLHCLWWWATSFAQDGELGRYDDEDIADAMMWEGDPAALVSAMISVRFIDEDSDGRRIHDWYEYAGKLIERREKDSERKRNSEKPRTASDATQKNSNGTPTEQQRISDGTPTEVRRNSERPRTASDVRVEKSREDKKRVEQNPTPYPSPEEGSDGVPSKPPPNSGGEAPTRFDAFWSAYPKKVGKEAARRVWDKIKPKPDGALLAKMLAVIERERRLEQWRREDGRYIPNPATWLNQGRWEDEITEGARQNAANSGVGKLYDGV